MIEAENGQEALEKLIAHPGIRLVISDLVMPVMDGNELLKWIKSDNGYSRLPFIMLTAIADVEAKINALRFGVDDYLTKPFLAAELLARVNNLLRNYEVSMAEELIVGKEPVPQDTSMAIQDREWLESFEKYVLENVANEWLSVTYLANQFNISESTLLRQLKRLTGLTPKQYLQEVRLNKARQLIESKAYDTVSEVALEVGFLHLKTLSRTFKARFGISPSALLRNVKASNDITN